MQKRTFLKMLISAATVSSGIVSTIVAHAADLRSAKAAGQVGERRDGYLGLVKPNAPQDVKNLVKTINAKRRANYKKIAKQNNVSPDQVAKLTAAKVIKSAPAGTFVQKPGGGWQKK